MKRAAALALALWGAAAFGQEIGKELPAPTPAPATTPAPASAPATNGAPASPGSDAPVAPGPAKGTFGLSVGFGGGALAAAPASGATAPAPGLSPTLGARFFVTDQLALDFDAGLQLVAVSGNLVAGFGVGAGVDFYFGSGALRPFVGGGVDFNRAVGGADVFGLDFAVGGGAEYWFSEHFSLIGRAQIVVPIQITSQTTTVMVATLSPGIGANFYF